MGIFRVFLNKKREVFNCRGMVLYHLIGLCPLMNIPNITRIPLYALNIWIMKVWCLPLNMGIWISQTFPGCNMRDQCGRRYPLHKNGRAHLWLLPSMSLCTFCTFQTHSMPNLAYTIPGGPSHWSREPGSSLWLTLCTTLDRNSIELYSWGTMCLSDPCQ